MSEKRERSPVTSEMVKAGAQAFDTGLGKLAESVLTAMAPWLTVTEPMREKGAGVLLGGGSLEPVAHARAIFNAMTEGDRRAGEITADMVKAGANALAVGAKYLAGQVIKAMELGAEVTPSMLQYGASAIFIPGLEAIDHVVLIFEEMDAERRALSGTPTHAQS
jgi:hypothetical protein